MKIKPYWFKNINIIIILDIQIIAQNLEYTERQNR